MNRLTVAAFLPTVPCVLKNTKMNLGTIGMNRYLSLLRLTTFFLLVFSSHLFAIEVQDAVVTEKENGMWRSYTLTTNGKPDERFTFTAHRGNEFRWDLYIKPSDIFDWASELSFKDYTDVIYRCVDRFMADVPDGQVWSVHVSITRESKTWQDIKKDIVPLMKKRSGFAVAFSGMDHGGAEQAVRFSPEIKQLGEELEKRLRRRFAYSMFDLDYLIMRISTPEDAQRTWQDIVKLPDLSLDMHSLNFSLNFEPVGKTNKN